MKIGKIEQLTSMSDILPQGEKRKEKILHAVKRVAMIRVELDKAIDDLVNEVFK